LSNLLEYSVTLVKRIQKEFDFLKGNYLYIVTSWFILDFFTEIPSTYYPLYIKSLGGTATAIGLIGFIDMLSMAVVQIPGGYLADKYGRKNIIVAMTFVIAFSKLFYILAPNWQFILVGALIGGFARIYLPALEAIIADSLPSNQRGIGYSLIKLITQVSTTPSPLIAAYLFSKYGLDKSMRIEYGLLFTALLFTGFLRSRLSETVTKTESANSNELADSLPSSFKEIIGVWKFVPKPALYLLIIQLLHYFSVSLQYPVYVLYFIGDLGISKQGYSYIMTILSITTIIVALPIGKIVDKIGRKPPLILANLLVFAFIPLIIFGNFIRLVIAMSILAFSQLLFSTASAALNVDLVPIELRGKVYGLSSFLTFTSMSLGQLLGGIFL